MAAGPTPPINPPRESRKIVVSKKNNAPPEHISERQEDRADRWQRLSGRLITIIIVAFVGINVGVLVLIYYMWHAQVFGPSVAPGLQPHPIITEGVVLRLITAISAQLGALAVGVGAALYRQDPR